MKSIILPTALSVIFALATPLAAQESVEPPMRVVTSFFPTDLNPAVQGDYMTEYGAAQTLMQLRENGEFHPWLAESVSNIDDTRWRVALRPEIDFQNGRPLNAEAVAASMIHTLENSAGARGTVPDGFSVTVASELEIIIDTGSPFAGLPGVLSRASYFTIYDVEEVEAVEGDWARLAGAGIYTGPYEVVSHDPEEWRLSANDSYWEGAPGLSGVEVQLVPDPNARVLAVQNGEADVVLYAPTAAKPVVDATPGIHFSVGILDSRGFMMFLNSNMTPFDDVRVRLATARAIDTDELANVVFGGVFVSAEGLYSPAFPYALNNQRHDVEEAKALLEEAGWVEGPDGVREKDGARLEIVTLIHPQQPDLAPMSSAIQAQLRVVGIDMQIRSVDDINEAMSDGRGWQGAMSSSSFGNWGQPENFLDSRVVSGAPENHTGYSNAELDNLAQEMRSEFDPDRRTAILQRVQEILVQEDPYGVQLVFQRTRAIVNDRFADYAPGFQNQFINWRTSVSE